MYRGILNTGTENKEVAVKIVECRSGAQADDADAEGLLGLTLEHPNVVQVWVLAWPIIYELVRAALSAWQSC